MKYNQALNEILANLDNDSSLNSRVKLYRDQLMQYRTTYEDDPSLISLIRWNYGKMIYVIIITISKVKYNS